MTHFGQAYSDLKSIPNVQLPMLAITLAMKGFAQAGDMNRLLEAYYKLYDNGHLPERVHWECMMWGAARAGDFKHFARFYHRLIHKGFRPSDDLMRKVFAEWDVKGDWNWKRVCPSSLIPSFVLCRKRVSIWVMCDNLTFA